MTQVIETPSVLDGLRGYIVYYFQLTVYRLPLSSSRDYLARG
jgi:hypothetical protein